MDEDASVRAVAEQIRMALIETALGAYEDAAANGLCAQGAWECAIDSMRHARLNDLLPNLTQSSDDQISSRLPSGSRR